VKKLGNVNSTHENIVQILGHGPLREPARYPFYIGMELCDIDLTSYIYHHNDCEPHDRMFHHSLPPRDQPSSVWKIMKQISSGVAFMHKHKQVHRDLKPANSILFIYLVA